MPSLGTRCRITVRVVTVAIWVQFALWTMSLPRILDTIEARPRKTMSPDDIEYMIRLILRVSNVKPFVIRRNCLKKNLLSYYLLVTSNVKRLALHIGVQNPNQGLDGHCWLSLNGTVYLDDEHNVSKYTVMYSRGV